MLHGIPAAERQAMLFQPAYSPEVNPAEHIWQHVRENGNFKNRTFDSMEDVERQPVIAVNTLLSDKEAVKSITGFHWIVEAL
jgi:transposase